MAIEEELLMMTVTCTECAGSGKVGEAECPVCLGNGAVADVNIDKETIGFIATFAQGLAQWRLLRKIFAESIERTIGPKLADAYRRGVRDGMKAAESEKNKQSNGK